MMVLGAGKGMKEGKDARAAGLCRREGKNPEGWQRRNADFGQGDSLQVLKGREHFQMVGISVNKVEQAAMGNGTPERKGQTFPVRK